MNREASVEARAAFFAFANDLAQVYSIQKETLVLSTKGGPMSFQAPISVADAISRIRTHRLLLPAIQREFVWGPEKVEWLFDSLLQGYPIGSFLFWEVHDSKAKTDYRYYEFLREYQGTLPHP